MCLRLTALIWLIVFITRPVAGQTTRPESLTMTLSPAGDVKLSIGSRVVADGSLYVEYGAGARPANQLDLGQPTEVTGVQDAPGHGVVTRKYAAFVSVFDYTLDGEDLVITAKLTNNDPKRTLAGVNFAALKFHFEHNPFGTLAWWHWSYRAAHSMDQIYHPSYQTPCGCVYAADEHLGIGLFSGTEFERQDLISSVWEKDNQIAAECQTEFFTDRTVPPASTVVIDLHCRISTDTSPHHLMDAYKRVYQDHFPKPLFEPDARVVLQYATSDQSHVTADNPLGYNGPLHRFDKRAGVNAYTRLILPALKKADGLGVIFWDPGGLNSVMYPPDFDVFPESVQPNIAILKEGFKTNGLRMGLCARCGDGVVRADGKPPALYRLSPDNPADMKTVVDRFHHAMDMGFDMFYLDSFGGNGIGDQKMLVKYRQAVGPHVLLYTELVTDMSLPYAGAYAEWRGTRTIWYGPEVYDAMRYFCPESTWLVISRTKQAIPPEFEKLKMTPLVLDEWVNHLPLPAKPG